MRTQQIRFRLTAAAAIAGIALGNAWMTPAAAQDTGDPPARVGRIAGLTGTVSFRTSDAADWTGAVLNYPVTSGNDFWTEPEARATIGISGNRLVLDGLTELDVATLDTASFSATEPQGRTYLHLAWLQPGETWSLQTPRGLVSIAQPGRYEIDAGDTAHPTRVTVVDGAASVSTDTVTLDVRPGQTAVISGNDSYTAEVVPRGTDPFLAAMLAAERPPPQPAVAPPPVVARMTGAADLAAYGTWERTPQYGTVWYPRVTANYVPYRNGHWAYVAPWGWTWVDDAPWGFAPFHYGRWVQISGRWGWVPVAPGVSVSVSVPVYAPALVNFFAVGTAAAVGVTAGFALGALSGGSVGWAPLGPHEVYHPPYRVSERYVRNVNVTSIRNVTRITNVTNNDVHITNIENRNAMTVVPATAMATSRPVARTMEHLPPREIATAHPVFGRPAVQPTAAAIGVTPRLAQEMKLPPAPAGLAAPRQPAPGPARVAHQPGAPIPLPAPRTPAAHAAGTMPPQTEPVRRPPAAEAPHPAQPQPVHQPEPARLPAAEAPHPAQAQPAHQPEPAHPPAAEAPHPAQPQPAHQPTPAPRHPAPTQPEHQGQPQGQQQGQRQVHPDPARQARHETPQPARQAAAQPGRPQHPAPPRDARPG